MRKLTIKELIEELKKYDDDCQVELYYYDFKSEVAYENYDIERIYFEERNINNAVVFEIVGGECVI